MKAIVLLNALVSSCARRRAVIWAVLLAAVPVPVFGQGTVTFDARPFFSGTDYYELGMWLHTVVPTGSSGYDNMVVVGPIPPGGNAPQNSTPYMGWFQQFNPYDYVALTRANGDTFGLTSVQLADPMAPSPSPVPISFVGHLLGGSTTTQTFTTPGNGASTFQNYSFTSAFASGLTSVDILAPRWAMDNLVFTIPEPAAGSLLALGLLVLALAHRSRHAPGHAR
jgi:hypothetical protein